MARWENEDVSGLDLPDPESLVTTFYDKNLNVCNEKQAILKTVNINNSTNGSITTTHYIRYSRGELLDPHNIDFGTQIKNFAFKKVNYKIYTCYTKYLKTKNRLYFTQARRLNMEQR